MTMHKTINADPDDSAALLLAQQRADHRRLGTPDAAVRRDRLARLADVLTHHRSHWIDAVNADFGHRSDFETQIADIGPPLMAIKHARRHLAQWMKSKQRQVGMVSLPGRARVDYVPVGVVGIISPWNFPISLSFSPTCSALAAGNRVMIKPSEFTPATSQLMAELIGSAFEPSEIAVVTGDEAVGRAFAGLPFDHLLFTGATSVGRHVMRAASEHLVPVTLELGGKSPVIVDRGYSIKKAAGSIAFGKFANAGQICIAPDYILVPREHMCEFVAELNRTVAAMYPSLRDNGDYTSIINARHFERLRRLVEDAESKGATITEINPAREDFARQPALKIPPTLIRDVTEEMAVMQEEIFGPVLPVLAYDALDDAIAYVNDHPKPLALYLFSDNDRTRTRVLNETISGGVTINDTLQHYLQDDLPFGGVGPSGMGAYHGFDGFQTFSHRRAVFTQARFNGAAMVRAPYGRLARNILKLMS
jgi:coniferyl-aldehyde dehydrogenase